MQLCSTTLISLDTDYFFEYLKLCTYGKKEGPAITWQCAGARVTACTAGEIPFIKQVVDTRFKVQVFENL